MAVEMDGYELDNAPPQELSVGASKFVEGMGLLMEGYGLPRIGGRILALLMLTEKPLSLDDIASLLKVSRASVSTNIRMSEAGGLARRVSKPGDRRDYYIGSVDMWTTSITTKWKAQIEMVEVARDAMPHIPPDDTVAHERLQEFIDFFEFLHDELNRILEDWKTFKSKTYGNDK
jgi:DNA-binding transcriptional regulator GbsR (MarR family)